MEIFELKNITLIWHISHIIEKSKGGIRNQ